MSARQIDERGSVRSIGFAIYYGARSFSLTVVSVAFALVFAVVRRLWPAAAPALVRRYLQWCGGGFVKLGQVLAMRFDLLPPAYYRELMQLLDRMPPLPVSAIRALLSAELGPRAAELTDLTPEPLGTASIAQVHGARLADGTDVVVKIARPGVAIRLAIDLVNLRALARLAELLGLWQGRDLTGLVREVTRLSHEELDFRREAFQIDMMHRRLASDDLDHRAPRVYFDYSTPRLITMERLCGVWVRELIACVEHNDTAALTALAERGIRPERTARLLLHSILTQCLVHRVFHADPHAGNVLVLDGGTLGYIDFGMVGRLDERLAALQLRVIEGIAREHYQAAFVAMLATIEPLASRDTGEFQAQVQELFATWRMVAAHPAATVAEKSSGLFFLRVADLVRGAKLRLPSRMLRYYRAQIVCDMAIYGLSPMLSPTAEFARFFTELHRRELGDAVSAEHAVAAWRTIAIDGPRALAAALQWAELRLPRLGEAVGQQLTGFERALNVVARNLQRGALAAAAVVVGIRLTGSPHLASTAWFPWWAWAAALAALGVTLGQARDAADEAP